MNKTADATLDLRPAVIEDMELVFQWRNDPWLVPFSSSQTTVSWEEHENWFKNSLNDDDTLILIIEVDGQSVGQVRFNRLSSNEAVVAIYMIKPYTGKGYGTRLLTNACRKVKDIWPIKEVYAYIRHDNEASISAFERAGFNKRDKADQTPKDHICYGVKVG